MGPCFISVGADGGKTGIWLSELKVTGYENSEYWWDEQMETGGFLVKELYSNGSPKREFEWKDYFDTDVPGDWQGGVWKDTDGGAIIGGKTDETDFFIRAGLALWCSAPPAQEGAPTYWFVSSGEVLKGKVGFELTADGNCLAANMLPADVDLTEVQVTGYEDAEYWWDEQMETGGFLVKELYSNGSPKREAEWKDYFDSAVPGAWQGGVWKDTDDGHEIAKEEFVISAGDALWASAPALWEGADPETDKYLIVFPAVIPAEK